MRLTLKIESVFAGLLCVLVLMGTSHATENSEVPLETVETTVRELMPNTNVTGISATHMKAIYVVNTPKNVFYIHHPSKTFIFGELMAMDHEGLPTFPTEQHKEESVSALVKRYQQHAIVMGSEDSTNTIVEFTRPDCVHCRAHHEFISTLDDVKRIVFLVPSESDALNEKINPILCSQSPAEDMDKLYQGERLAKGECEGLDQRLEQLRSIAKTFGVTGTPYLIVNNKKVGGFNKEKIYSHLKKDYEI